MATESFVAIGHITNDLVPNDHLGGGVSYAAVAASRLGQESHIITKCPPDHPYVKDLREMDIDVLVLPSRADRITSFKINYGEDERRTLKVTEKQEPITIEDLYYMPGDVLERSTILIAPVIGEVDLKLLPVLSQYGQVSITPQGYFRDVDETGLVRHRKWSGFEEYLTFCEMAIFSDKDIEIDGAIDLALLQALRQASKTVILTKGAKGATIFQQGQTMVHSKPFPLMGDEAKDYTGAGDSFAAAFINSYRFGGIANASCFANFYAALKIMGLSGTGLDSVPTTNQMRKFINQNQERIDRFLRSYQ